MGSHGRPRRSGGGGGGVGRGLPPIAPLVSAGLAAALAWVSWPSVAFADVVYSGSSEDDAYESPFEPPEEREYGLGAAWLYLRYARTRDPAAVSGLSDLVVGGLSTRAVYGNRVGYGAGLDLWFGGAGAPGFAFGFEVHPAGAAVAIGPTGLFGLFLGVGVDGVTSRVPYTLTMPAELRLELDVTRRARLGALFAVAWTPVEEARKGGSLLLPFADETTMALTARFGKTFPRYGASMGRGYFMRLERREQMRTVSLGFAFGVEIDAAD